MSKSIHELRDPVHTFIHFSNDEKKVIDSPFFQRLRHIKQLSMASYVYPGAVHSRFEHCIGAMELAGRVFDVLFLSQNRHPESYDPYADKFNNPALLERWKLHVRMAALLHDVGHPPFSHATEELFPDDFNHEAMTKEIICNSELTTILEKCEIPYTPELVAKLAVGPKEYKDATNPFEYWELLLNEIIVGDAFGVDRMDYLLRDAHHCGSSAGKFDHDRLIQTLRILKTLEGSQSISIGIEHGGIYSTEALLIARYHMHMQIYLHRVSTAYNIHCKRFAKAFLESTSSGTWSVKPEEFLLITDNEILAEINKAGRDKDAAGYIDAKRILDRNHLKFVFEFDSEHSILFMKDGFIDELNSELLKVCSKDNFHLNIHKPKSTFGDVALDNDFVVWMKKIGTGELISGKKYSKVISKLVKPTQNYVIAEPDKKDEIKSCIESFLDKY